MGCAIPAGAQGIVRDAPIAPFSAAFVSTGTLLVDVSKLNARFQREDLPTSQRFFALSNDGYSVGFGGYGAIYNRLTAGAEWHMADMGEESSPSGRTNRLTTSYWMVTGGFAAWTTWRFTLMPFAGVGLGTLKLTLKSRDGGPTVSDAFDPTFDEVVETPGALSTMTGSYLMVQPGLAVDYLMLKSDASTWGVVLGIRVASPITPNRTTWKYQGREVFGGPDAGPAGGVFRLQAGIGGFRLGGPATPKR